MRRAVVLCDLAITSSLNFGQFFVCPGCLNRACPAGHPRLYVDVGGAIAFDFRLSVAAAKETITVSGERWIGRHAINFGLFCNRQGRDPGGCPLTAAVFPAWRCSRLEPYRTRVAIHAKSDLPIFRPASTAGAAHTAVRSDQRSLKALRRACITA